MSILRVNARGETFSIRQVAGNLFVCAEPNGGCCCGHTEKGRIVVNKDLYADEWDARKLRNSLHLSFVGCLGPCPVGNNAMLMIHGRAVWFKDLNEDRFIPMIFDYAEAILASESVVPPTGELAQHFYERYAPSEAAEAPNAGPANFDGIDPVCMMTVDPASAEWRSEYGGKSYYFCCSGCKRSFDKSPASYLGAGAPAESTPETRPEHTPASGGAMSMTFVVPNISCDHCARSIRRAAMAIAGVQAVEVDVPDRKVTLSWAAPTSWDEIRRKMTEIDYPPQETPAPA